MCHQVLMNWEKTMVEEKSIGQIYSECCDWMIL